jgi:hypothetical protein
MSDIQLLNLKSSNQNKSIINSEEKELTVFLYTIFQYYLEKAVELMNSDDPVRKEGAHSVLFSLLEKSYPKQFKSNKIITSCIKGIINFYIGLLRFSDEDQSKCEAPFLLALDYFNTLPVMVKIRYINIYQEIYNNLGIVFYNKGDIKKSLQYLGKAEQIYKVFNDLGGYSMTNNFTKFMLSCSKSEINTQNNSNSYSNNLNSDDKIEFFNFYIDGGLHKKNFEHNYTMTIFYYAQAFTKLGFRKKAIKYCSLTLKRQIEQNVHDLKDSVYNIINLSDFYIEHQHYAQAEYILISAISLLPDDQNKKKKLRAALHLQLGKYFLERLNFAVRQTREQLWINDNEELFSIVNKRIFTFNNLNIIWPKIEDVKDIEQAKLLFRLSNTQYKKCLEYYKLDGYVTEHINATRDLSQLYRYLTFFETDNNRIYAMLDRRVLLLEPIIKEINNKVFVVQWQELALELAEIYSEIFESKYEIMRIKQMKPKQSQLDEINTACDKAIKYYKDILLFIEVEYEKAQEKHLEDFTTIITIKLHLARLYSKLDSKDVKKKVNNMAMSLKTYEDTRKVLSRSSFVVENPSLQEQLKICEEMVNLLPVKISKINRGEEV